MKHIKFFLAAAFLFVFSVSLSFASDTFDSFAFDLGKWADGLTGSVTPVSKGHLRVDGVNTAGIVKGMTFNVTRPGEELIHPVTGKSLGRKTIILGRVIADDVHEGYFTGSYNGNTDTIKGDGVSYGFPIEIKFDFSGLAAGEQTEASFAILKSKKFKESEKSDFTISCVKESSEKSNVSCNLFYGDNISLVSANIPVISVTVADEGDSDSGKFGDDFLSAAIGFVYGSSKGLSVVASQEKSVAVISYNSESGFKKNTSLDGDFYNIVNVELADLNGNGVDEIFVSNISKTNKTESFIYEYSDGTFKAVASNVPYLFRSYYSDGKKTLTCQKFEEGDFNSRVAEYVYLDGEYLAGNVLDSSLGVRLYGFSKTTAGESSFDTGGGLLMRDSSGEVTRYKGNFGDTPHKLTYTIRDLEVAKSGADSGAITNVEERILSVAVYPRIIEIARGKYFLAGNVPISRRTVGNDEYKSSFYGLYTLFGGKAEPFWQTSDVEPAIVETDITVSENSAYVLLFKNYDGGFLSGTDSQFKIISIDLR